MFVINNATGESSCISSINTYEGKACKIVYRISTIHPFINRVVLATKTRLLTKVIASSKKMHAIFQNILLIFELHVLYLIDYFGV